MQAISLEEFVRTLDKRVKVIVEDSDSFSYPQNTDKLFLAAKNNKEQVSLPLLYTKTYGE